MAEININGCGLSNPLMRILMDDNLHPGEILSYELAKLIYISHPLGGCIVDKPINLAQSQSREYSIYGVEEDQAVERIINRFIETRKNLNMDYHIATTARLSRIYGISSLVYGFEGKDTSTAVKPVDMNSSNLYFNWFDPLNTSGSLVLNQNPNAVDFQKPQQVTVQGKTYHPSRTCVIQNESPIYLEFNASTFGFTGRSCYQRALFPLKSFINTMIADDIVSRKVAVIVAKMKTPSSIINNMMNIAAGIKRNILKESKNDNVISIDPEESIESLNLQNLEGPARYARENIINNIAISNSMPPSLLKADNFGSGGEGADEDSKAVAQYISSIREWLEPLYRFTDNIAFYQAWTEDFFNDLQKDFTSFEKMDYNTFFYKCTNGFESFWPSLIQEPDSDRVKIEDVKLRSMIAALQVLTPLLDANNRVALVGWAAQTLSDNRLLFPTPLTFDIKSLSKFTPELMAQQMGSGDEGIRAPQGLDVGENTNPIANQAKNPTRIKKSKSIRPAKGHRNS